MNVIGVIPARWGSTRFPGKSLVPLLGKPLIQWVVERSRQSKRLEDVVVATDDERIRRVVSGFGTRVIMTRSDHPSGTDRVAEAVKGMRVEMVANIQGDEPLIDPHLIDQLVEVMILELCWDMATAVAPLTTDVQNTSICKVVFTREGQALYFSRCPIPYVRENSFRADQSLVARRATRSARGAAGGEPLSLYWRHIGIYLYRKPFLDKVVAESPCRLEQAECLEQLRALHMGARIKVVKTAHVGIGVDTPADVPKVEGVMKQLGMG